MVKKNISKEAKRIEEDSTYSAKGHFYASQFWSKLHLRLGIPTTILAAISGTSALSQFDNSNVVAGVLAMLVAALVAITTFINPNEKANLHYKAGNEHNSLKNKARIFSDIELVDITSNEVMIAELKQLNEERGELNRKTPQIPKWAYKKAKKGIYDGESDYKIDN